MDADNLKIVLAQAAEVGVDVLEQALRDWASQLAQEEAERERASAINSAAAAMKEANIPDGKIVTLLQKYYNLEKTEAISALGEGCLIFEKKKYIAKARQKIESASKKNKG